MVEETFIAHTPKEAYDLAKEKYENVELEILRAEQIKDEHGSLVSKITILVHSDEFKESIGINEEEELVKEMVDLRQKIEIMKEAIVVGVTPKETDTSPKNTITQDENHAEDNQDIPTDSETSRNQEDEATPEDLIVSIETVNTENNNDASPTMPPPDCSIYDIMNIMIKNGIGKKWLDSTMTPILSDNHLNDEDQLLSVIASEIENGINVCEENVNKPFMMMLVGSTGVGKTTTIAKLAARYSLLMDKELKVALINLDSFRVGAYEQLNRYAQMMKMDHYRAQSADEFEKLLAQMQEYDVVLIDTAGISPYDSNKLLNTVEFLKKTGKHNVQTHLVVAATAKKDDIRDIYEHFSFLNIKNVILTKFDETKKVGELFSFLLENDVCVSYLSSGQNVPDDLEVATKSVMLNRFIGELDV